MTGDRSMPRPCAHHVVLAVTALLTLLGLGACGGQPSSGASSSMRGGPTAEAGVGTPGVPKAHPQVIEPQAGQAATAAAPPSAPATTATTTDPSIVGDPNAHAPSLAQVRKELALLNLCGGATSSADTQTLVPGGGPGFVADPGTSQTQGELPLLTSRLNQLGQALGVTIYGISGYRSPAHSVAVGGYANDPHTQGLAEDIGVNSLVRSSAAQISEAQLARFGLYRPFDPSDDPNNTEVNHVQLIPAGGALTLAQAQASFDPDPRCQ